MIIYIVNLETEYEATECLGVFSDEALANECYDSAELEHTQTCMLEELEDDDGRFAVVSTKVREGPYTPPRQGG